MRGECVHHNRRSMLVPASRVANYPVFCVVVLLALGGRAAAGFAGGSLMPKVDVQQTSFTASTPVLPTHPQLVELGVSVNGLVSTGGEFVAVTDDRVQGFLFPNLTFINSVVLQSNISGGIIGISTGFYICYGDPLAYIPYDFTTANYVSGMPECGSSLIPSADERYIYYSTEHKSGLCAVSFFDHAFAWSANFTSNGACTHNVAPYMGQDNSGNLYIAAIIDSASNNVSLFQVNGQTGDITGSWPLEGADCSNHMVSTVDVQLQRVYVCSYNSVWAIDVASGEKLWNYSDPSVGDPLFGIFPGCALNSNAGATVVYASMGPLVVALNASTGVELWSSVLAASPSLMLVVGDGTIYVLDLDGFLTAIAPNGMMLWIMGGFGDASGLVPVGNTLLVSAGGFMASLEYATLAPVAAPFVFTSALSTQITAALTAAPRTAHFIDSAIISVACVVTVYNASGAFETVLAGITVSGGVLCPNGQLETGAGGATLAVQLVYPTGTYTTPAMNVTLVGATAMSTTALYSSTTSVAFEGFGLNVCGELGVTCFCSFFLPQSQQTATVVSDSTISCPVVPYATVDNSATPISSFVSVQAQAPGTPVITLATFKFDWVPTLSSSPPPPPSPTRVWPYFVGGGLGVGVLLVVGLVVYRCTRTRRDGSLSSRGRNAYGALNSSSY